MESMGMYMESMEAAESEGMYGNRNGIHEI